MVLLYGCIVYTAFLPTFLYAIGFVNGVAVPKNVDTLIGEPLPTWQALAINASLLGLFGIQHSIMARHWFKRRWTEIIHPAAERSTFVAITCAILGLIFWQWQAMPAVVWEITDPVARTVVNIISALGWAGVLVSTFLIDHVDLFGLSQVIRNYRGAGAEETDVRGPVVLPSRASPALLRVLHRFLVRADDDREPPGLRRDLHRLRADQPLPQSGHPSPSACYPSRSGFVASWKVIARIQYGVAPSTAFQILDD